MPATIEASEKPLNKIFSDDYFFEVPFYQRPYAWEEEQVDELLDDLRSAMERENDAPYFLGSIVLIKESGASLSQIVDGQQRLTTLTMLMCILRELSDDLKDDLDAFIVERGNSLKGTEDRFRISLRERDKEFFQTHLQKRNNLDDFFKADASNWSDSQKLLRSNARYLYRKLSESDGEERCSLATFVSTNCYMVVVSASDSDSAYRIFSVMNNRGLDLSPTDILKSEIIGGINLHEAQQEYADIWEEIETDLGRDDFRDLFAHIRTIYKKEKMRGTLQNEFRASVLSSRTGADFIDNILDPYSKAYDTVANKSYDGVDSNEINTYLRFLSQLDNFDWIPPVMAYLYRNQNNNVSPLLFLKSMDRLAYGLFIKRADVNERIRRYAEVVHAIENDKALDQDGHLYFSDEEKKAILQGLDGPVYLQPRITKPLLLRLDSIVAEVGAQYAYPTITVEHVLPQNPSAGSEWEDWFSDADADYWTHRIANLVLLSRRKNSRASNYEFDQKKNEYFMVHGTSHFALTTQVVNETEWTPMVLEHRQHELLNAFKLEWGL